MARIHYNRAHALAALGRLPEAQAHYERGLALCREIGDRQTEAATTGNLGNVFSFLGRLLEARGHIERYLVLSREIGRGMVARAESDRR